MVCPRRAFGISWADRYALAYPEHRQNAGDEDHTEPYRFVRIPDRLPGGGDGVLRHCRRRSGQRCGVVGLSGCIARLSRLDFPVLVAQGWIALWTELRPGSRAEFVELLPLLEPVFYTGTLLTLTLVCAAVLAAIAVLMIRARIRMVEIKTSSSEKNSSWRYDLHPRQIFTTLRDLVLMGKREQELPNRMYLDENDTGQANRDNEQFNGDLITEIQPVVEDIPESAVMRYSRIGGTVLAQILMLLGAVLFWLGAQSVLPHVDTWHQLVSQSANVETVVSQLLVPIGATTATLLAGLLLMGFGRRHRELNLCSVWPV